MLACFLDSNLVVAFCRNGLYSRNLEKWQDSFVASLFWGRESWIGLGIGHKSYWIGIESSYFYLARKQLYTCHCQCCHWPHWPAKLSNKLVCGPACFENKACSLVLCALRMKQTRARGTWPRAYPQPLVEPQPYKHKIRFHCILEA